MVGRNDLAASVGDALSMMQMSYLDLIHVILQVSLLLLGQRPLVGGVVQLRAHLTAVHAYQTITYARQARHTHAAENVGLVVRLTGLHDHLLLFVGLLRLLTIHIGNKYL